MPLEADEEQSQRVCANEATVYISRRLVSRIHTNHVAELATDLPVICVYLVPKQ